jgi:hypothetical protein
MIVLLPLEHVLAVARGDGERILPEPCLDVLRGRRLMHDGLDRFRPAIQRRAAG